MVEIASSLPVPAARTTTPEGNYSLADYKIPNSPQEFFDRLNGTSLRQIGKDAEDLISDGISGGMRRLLLRARLLEMRLNRPRVSEKTSMIVLGGLGSWKGIKLPNFVNPYIRDAVGSTYSPVGDYFKGAGFDVDESFPRSGFQTGDLEGTAANFERMVSCKLNESRIVVVFAQSFGGEVAQVYASRHPEQAKRMLFALVVSSLPAKVNFWAGSAVVAFNGTTSFKPMRETAEFMQSPQAARIQFVNIVTVPDHVLSGPTAPGVVRVTKSGHIGAAFDIENLDYVVDVTNERLDIERRREAFSKMMATTVPYTTAA